MDNSIIISSNADNILGHDPNGTFFTTKSDYGVSVEYDRFITVGSGSDITEVEVDEYGSVVSYILMRDGVVLLDLNADEYLKFDNFNTLIAGERLRLTVKKARKEKETK